MSAHIDKIREALRVSRAVHKSMCREDYVDMIDDAEDAIAALAELDRQPSELADIDEALEMVETEPPTPGMSRADRIMELVPSKGVRSAECVAPSAGLTVEDVMAIYLAHENYFNLHGGSPAKRSGNFRARLEAAAKAK